MLSILLLLVSYLTIVYQRMFLPTTHFLHTSILSSADVGKSRCTNVFMANIATQTLKTVNRKLPSRVYFVR